MASGDSSVVFSFQVFVCDSAFLDIFKIHITENRKLADYSNAFFMGEKGYNQYKQLGFGTDRFAADGRHSNFDIAGQFEDFKIRSMLLSEEHPLLIQLLPSDSIGFPWQILVEVSDGDLGSYKQQIDDMFSSLTETPYFESKWYGDMIEDTYRDVINMNDIVVIFTCVALLISLLGLMAMNIYMVSQRKRDIAVRKGVFSCPVMEIAACTAQAFTAECQRQRRSNEFLCRGKSVLRSIGIDSCKECMEIRVSRIEFQFVISAIAQGCAYNIPGILGRFSVKGNHYFRM